MDSPRKITKNAKDKDAKSIIHQSSTIADLPEAIVHHIASLLSLKDMARMSTCLKPWRNICYTCQYLTVDVDKFCGYDMQSIFRFVCFMERMIRIPRESHLERFTLICRTIATDHNIIDWVIYAVKCSVKELELDIVLQSFVLPVQVFRLESLRILKLHMNYDDPFTGLNLEQCISLETLTLSYFFGITMLNIMSLSLQTLSICDAKKSALCHLNISCQNLKTLHLNLEYHAQNSFKLSSPALQTFHVCFSNAVDCCWSPLKSLQVATVSVSTCNYWNDAYPFGSQLLGYLTTAKELHLCGMLMQVLAWMVKGQPSFLLCNINYLKLHTCMSDDETLLIMYLLRRFPNLQALVISQETYHYNNHSFLPSRSELLQGVLSSDLVGFHTGDYAIHFASACSHILNKCEMIESEAHNSVAVIRGGDVAQVAYFPIGIDYQHFIQNVEKLKKEGMVNAMKNKFPGRKVILGVDRLDMIKGIPKKLQAFERFLEDNPELREKVLLLQIAVPTRTDVPEYKMLADQVHQIVGRINGKYGTFAGSPVHHLDRSVSFDELCCLYAAADIALVTSTRDGMNLVSHKFIACQDPKRGVLILSEFAGAATLLRGCLKVNPWDINGMSHTIKLALEMSEQEIEHRYNLNFTHIVRTTAQTWADNFVRKLTEA